MQAPSLDELQVARLQRNPQTFAADVAVPIAQNIAGGIGAACILGIGAMSISNAFSWSVDASVVMQFSALGGIVVASAATVWRSFADEIGMVRIVYEAGQRSMEEQVNALEGERRNLSRQLARLKGAGVVAETVDAEHDVTRRNVEQMIAWHYEGQKIARRVCEERGISQTQWNKAMGGMVAAGIVQGGKMQPGTVGDALAEWREYVSTQDALANGNFVGPSRGLVSSQTKTRRA